MKKTFIPEIRILLNKPEADAEQLFENCFPRNTGWDWSEYTYRRHPDLKQRLAGIKNKKQFYDICLEYVKDYYKKNKKDLTEAIHLNQDDIDKYGPNFLRTLAKHFETQWPQEHAVITAYITISPTCPRFLDTWSFWTGSKGKLGSHRRVMYHEILHFLWFKKWKEVFPDADPNEFEGPHLIWKISEIMAPIILNHHPTIQLMGQLRDGGYEEFQKAKIGRMKLIPYFERMYLKHLASDEIFDEFLKKLWKSAMKYRSEIERI